MIIDFNTHKDELFTEVYKKLQRCKNRYRAVGGGASSSKSFSVHQESLIKTFEKGKRILYIRKNAATIRQSCHELHKNIISRWDLSDSFDIRYSNDLRDITNVHTGSQILYSGIDDPEKIKSIAGITEIVIEEASEITKNDFLELDRRVRGVKNIRITLVFNPIDETHWIKDLFFDKDDYKDRTDIVWCTYKDNLKFLTQDDILALENLKNVDYNQYRVYALGEWGKMEVERPYAYNFNQDKHVKPCDHFAGFQHAISIDFNIDPMVCEFISYDIDTQGATHYYHYAELAIESGDVFELCERIKAKIPPILLFNTVFTGDATGRNRSVVSIDHASAWTLVCNELNISDNRLHLSSVNPSVKSNRTDINAVLSRHMDFRVDPSCEYLIRDLKYTEALPDGTINKKSRTNVHQQADALDCFRYGVNTWLGDFIRRELYLKR